MPGGTRFVVAESHDGCPACAAGVVFLVLGTTRGVGALVFESKAVTGFVRGGFSDEDQVCGGISGEDVNGVRGVVGEGVDIADSSGTGSVPIGRTASDGNTHRDTVCETGGLDGGDVDFEGGKVLRDTFPDFSDGGEFGIVERGEVGVGGIDGGGEIGVTPPSGFKVAVEIKVKGGRCSGKTIEGRERCEGMLRSRSDTGSGLGTDPIRRGGRDSQCGKEKTLLERFRRNEAKGRATLTASELHDRTRSSDGKLLRASDPKIFGAKILPRKMSCIPPILEMEKSGFRNGCGHFPKRIVPEGGRSVKKSLRRGNERSGEILKFPDIYRISAKTRSIQRGRSVPSEGDELDSFTEGTRGRED